MRSALVLKMSTYVSQLRGGQPMISSIWKTIWQRGRKLSLQKRCLGCDAPKRSCWKPNVTFWPRGPKLLSGGRGFRLPRAEEMSSGQGPGFRCEGRGFVFQTGRTAWGGAFVFVTMNRSEVDRDVFGSEVPKPFDRAEALYSRGQGFLLFDDVSAMRTDSFVDMIILSIGRHWPKHHKPESDGAVGIFLWQRPVESRQRQRPWAPTIHALWILTQ